MLLAIDVVLMLAAILALTFGYRDAYRGRERSPILVTAADPLAIICRSPRLRTFFPAVFLLFSSWMLAFVYIPFVVTSRYGGDDPATVIGVVGGSGGVATLALSRPSDRSPIGSGTGMCSTRARSPRSCSGRFPRSPLTSRPSPSSGRC